MAAGTSSQEFRSLTDEELVTRLREKTTAVFVRCGKTLRGSTP